ncbi:putative nucleotide-binding protein [Rhizobium petrolearium]|uniref:TIR domain-containing protein n=1 Tax=Neorhizobium petrolearium TaxID=515361 RepID=UPI001AE80ED1|nr:TIR domain-containing protein [Neorhizobium petrolearium]MBP1843908.1 putative nucleotide-binding protein [Neorhizobium petrolearium]
MDGRDFLQIADKLEESSSNFERRFKAKLKRVLDAAVAIHEAWSGSNLGYQANVYYDGFRKPPAGAQFSVMHGIGEDWLSDTLGDWGEFSAAQVKTAVYRLAGNPEMADCESASGESLREFNRAKGEVLSGMNILLEGRKDAFLSSLLKQVHGVQIASAQQLSRAFLGGGQFMTQDTRALNGGARAAPHQLIIAETTALNQPAECGKQLAEIVRQIGSHLVRAERKTRVSSLVGTNVFIGHGRSSSWRELKDFIEDRLHLPSDEFNRVPVAGMSNITRLNEMLEAAAFAFLVLTAEDEQRDGRLNARMNVVHEVGLFQGRLGFMRAIVLLEDGCEEFSNIQGLGQIRFPKDNIVAAFEEIRMVLEREGLVGRLASS